MCALFYLCFLSFERQMRKVFRFIRKLNKSYVYKCRVTARTTVAVIATLYVCLAFFFLHELHHLHAYKNKK